MEPIEQKPKSNYLGIIITIVIFTLAVYGYVRSQKKRHYSFNPNHQIDQTMVEAKENLDKYRKTINNPTSNSLCESITNGLSRSFGFDLKVSVPCIWDSIRSNDPRIIKNYGKEYSNYALTFSMTVSFLQNGSTQESMEENINENNMRRLAKGMDEYIDGEKTFIDSLPCAKITLRQKRKSESGDVYMNSRYYYIYYKNVAVMLSYISMSREENISTTEFKNNEQLFDIVARKTKILHSD